MGRRKVEVRREEILAATVEEMQRLGMDHTRVQDVAQALGVSTGLLFYHFDSKDNLLAAGLEYAAERDLARLDRALTRGRTPLERLRRGGGGARAATTVRIGAQLDGLSVAVVVYRSVSRAQLRRWIRAAVADELGIDAELLA